MCLYPFVSRGCVVVVSRWFVHVWRVAWAEGGGVIGLMDVPVPTTIEFKNTNLCSEIRSGLIGMV